MDVICALDLAISLTIDKYRSRKNISMDEVADRLNITPAVFRNKACATNIEHKFRSDQLVDIQKLTGDDTITQVMSEIVKIDKTTPRNIVMMIVNTGVSAGAMMKVVHDAIEDGVVTQTELKQSIAAIAEGIQNFKEIESALMKMALKPQYVRPPACLELPLS